MNKNLASISLATLLALGVSAMRATADSIIYNRTQTLENINGSGSFFAGNHNTNGGYSGTPLPDSWSYAGPLITLDMTAQYGYLHSKNIVDVTSGPGTSQVGQTSTGMKWDDDVTISAPGLDGQAGTLNVRSLLNGRVDNLGAETFSFNFVFNVNGAETGTGIVNTNGNIPQTFDNQAFTLSVGFTFGTPFHLFSTIVNNGSQTVSGGATRYYHGDVTAVWDGAFTSVVDGSSAPVSSFTMTSGSGTDYTQTVPEPSSALLVALGSVVMLQLWRRVVQAGA